MSATVGAALKKILVALLSEPKVIKTIFGIVIGIIIVVIMPIVAVVSIFNGSMEIDTAKLTQSIQENISAEQMENFQLINDTMTKVEKELAKKKLSDYNTQAEVIYLFSLSDKSKEKDFVKNFVSCFKKNQSDEDLIKAVNSKFGIEIKYEEFKNVMQTINSTKISTSGYTDKTTKNNLDLVKWCKNAEQNGWGYVYRDTLKAEALDIVEDLVSKINSEIYISVSLQQKLLQLAEKLSKTGGKKVYGYLKADVKALVDSIVDELASDNRIKKLYDLWYEQKENTIRTYTDEMPERIPLVDNKEFKSIKNAVIKEALKLNSVKDEAEESEYTNEENTSAEPTNDSNKGVIYPKYSIKTKRSSVAVSSLHLLRSLCNMLQNRLRFEEKKKSQQTDKKLQQKINDKKQAQGLKM